MAVPRDGAGWVGQARWAEDHGFAILQVPDTLNTASPFPALAAAAAVTTTLHVRPWVLAAPLRHPAAVVREVAAVQLLSGGRGELGIGIGRPGSEAEAGRLGMPWGSPAERRALVREVVEVVRAAVSPTPPIAITAAGPRMLAEAAEYADRIGLALGPTSTVADLVAVAGVARSARRVPLTLQLSGIGDRTVAWGGGGPRIDAAGAATVLPGDPGAAAALLEERRDRFGVDEVVVPGELAETFLPILARLG
jgi:alkanesulfonate monooxygenase SsuD/methylene tetrahydromethanopterin reductase-like flavin-dependent oxidoreductase (luciferase family)